MAIGQLTTDSDKNTEKDGKKGTDSVIPPDKDQHDATHAIYIFETYTHKRENSGCGIGFFHRAATIT